MIKIVRSLNKLGNLSNTFIKLDVGITIEK